MHAKRGSARTQVSEVQDTVAQQLQAMAEGQVMLTLILHLFLACMKS